MTEGGGGVLIIGWGNPLRGDDGLGWHAATVLAADPRLAGATVLARHQLTPELAEDVAAAGLVVLVDARDLPAAPGTVGVQRVTPDPAAPPLTHHLGPAALAALSAELYGRVPPIVLVSVGAASFGPSERLSPQVVGALGKVVATVAGLVARGSAAVPGA